MSDETELRTGILLVNLGTPLSPSPYDVKRYLTEFLTDERVIDLPWLWRELLVRGWIIPRRYKETSRNYKSIWSSEGSPLFVYGKRVRDALQLKLGEKYKVVLGMRYQSPSLVESLEELRSWDIQKLVILPLFPQYASATTGSVHQRVMEIISQWMVIPAVQLIDRFGDHPGFIQAVKERAKTINFDYYDKILFSYHGLPLRQVKKSDRHGCCLQSKECCQELDNKNWDCYSAQCYSNTHSVVKALNIPKEKFMICFQSRLGSESWLQPYFLDTIQTLASEGYKKLLVFSLSFVCDCLETTSEIGVEYAHQFKQLGGECLDLVPGLNDDPAWIEGLRQIITR